MENAGLKVLGYGNGNVIIEDPACILRSFEVFAQYAWIIISAITGLFLFGWALSLIMGAKLNIFENMKSLFLILGVLTVTGPLINMVYGGDLFGQGCKQINVPMSQINEIMNLKNSQFSDNTDVFVEEFDIYDSKADTGLSDDLRDLSQQFQ